jgi:hypothetical protein
MTSQYPVLDPPRHSRASASPRQHPPPSASPHQARTSSPLRAPKLMLVNGMGQMTSMPSPIIGGNSDDEPMSPDTTTQTQSQVLQGLSVPSLFDSPVKQNGGVGRYSPSTSPIRPPTSPPKRSSSPSKMILDAEGKPRPVNHSFVLAGSYANNIVRIIEEVIDINIRFRIRYSCLRQRDLHYHFPRISLSQHSRKCYLTPNARRIMLSLFSRIPSR